MKSAVDFLKEKGIIKEGYSSWRCVFSDGQEFIINELFEEYASQFREPSTQGGEEKIFLDSESTYSLMTSSDPEKVEKGKVLRVQELALQLVKKNKRIQVLEEALKQIRHKTYSRDTDDSILYEIDSVLTEAGFPYQSED